MESRSSGKPPALVTVFGLKPLRIGGVEAFARELSTQLGDQGWRSVLCFMEEPSGEVRRFLDLPNVSLEVMPAVQHSVRSASTMQSLLRRHKARVLLLQFTPFLSVYPWLAHVVGVDRVFFVDQGSQPEGWKDRRAPLWKRVMARWITRPLQGVISISDFNLRVQLSRGLIDPVKTRRIYNATDTARSHDATLGQRFRERHGIPAHRIVVAQVSWMIPEKGIVNLLEAMRLGMERHDNLHLVLAGEGPCRDEYQLRAREMGLENHVTWTGLVKDPFREGLFDAADIVCQLSRWEEAFGYVLAEAMVLERPVVATRVGAIPEVVQDGETGLLVERGDSIAAADAIVKLASDPALRERYGLAARERAQLLFDVKKNVGELLRVLGVSSGESPSTLPANDRPLDDPGHLPTQIPAATAAASVTNRPR